MTCIRTCCLTTTTTTNRSPPSRTSGATPCTRTWPTRPNRLSRRTTPSSSAKSHAEFERSIHARVDRGEPLTGETLTRTYCEILKRYHGVAEGVVDIDDAYCIEWAYIPHFYFSFYVYQYATSIAASALFAQRVAANEPGALTRYLDLLKAGGSGFPYDLVKKAGVDLATPAPYQALVDHWDEILGSRTRQVNES